MDTIHYLLWSNKHSAWWRPDGFGYTEDLAQAGAYTEAEAVMNVLRSALCMDRAQVTLMVAAPPGWTPPVPDLKVFGPGPLVEVLGAFLDSRGGKPTGSRDERTGLVSGGLIAACSFCGSLDHESHPEPNVRTAEVRGGEL